MTSERVSTAVGMVTGLTCKVMFEDMAIAVLTAFATGGAAYIGQIFIKYIHLSIKQKLYEKSIKKAEK